MNTHVLVAITVAVSLLLFAVSFTIGTKAPDWINKVNADLMEGKKHRAKQLEIIRGRPVAKTNEVTSDSDAHATAEIE